jgi:hypothetical protein
LIRLAEAEPPDSAAEENHLLLRSSLQVWYNGRGMCSSRLGDAAKAASDIDKAVALVAVGALRP